MMKIFTKSRSAAQLPPIEVRQAPLIGPRLSDRERHRRLRAALKRRVSKTGRGIVLASLLALLLTSLCFAADLNVPLQNDPHKLVRVTTPAQGSYYAWRVVGVDGVIDHEANAGRMVFAAPPGKYYVFLFVVTMDGIDEGDALVMIGPAPPVPIPPNPPTPPVPPTPVGPRAVLIIRETADTTPSLGRLVTALQAPTMPQQKYLKSKGHTCHILDDDLPGVDGKPSPAVEAWRPVFADIPLPALIVYDPKTKTVLHKGPCPETADAVVELLKAKGG